MTTREGVQSFFPINTPEAACYALKVMTEDGRMHHALRTRVCRAIAQFIVTREEEIRDIEHGAASLLVQAAAEVGRKKRCS